MKGRTHAASGLAAGALTLPWAPITGTGPALAWVAACGGLAMLPDLDQGGVGWRGVHGSTVARMWGPLTAVPAAVVGWAARGHRAGTHDILVAPAGAYALAWAATLNRWALLAAVALAVGLAFRATEPGNAAAAALRAGGVRGTLPRVLAAADDNPAANLALSAAVAWVAAPGAAAWLPAAYAAGTAVHIAGDACTTHGVPVPLSWLGGRRRRWGAPLFRTGSPVEAWLAGGFTAAAVVAAAGHTGLIAAVG